MEGKEKEWEKAKERVRGCEGEERGKKWKNEWVEEKERDGGKERNG